MKSLTSPLGLNLGGVGPKIFRNAMPFLLTAILTGIFFKSFSSLPFNRSSAIALTGIALISSGVLIYISSLVQFIREFPKGKLMTKGIYAFSRNPLYASWILLILPGFCFTFNNWIFLLAALAMYISLLAYIKSEESQLEVCFGEEYLAYKSRVRRVLFLPRFC